MEAAQDQAADFTGADDTGLVSVTMAAAGHVRDVTVKRGWREQLGAAGLAAAVRDAAAAAATARLESWGDAFIEQDQSPDPRPRPMPLSFETMAYQLDELATGKLAGGQRRAALEELLSMAEAIERGIDQVSTQLQGHLDAEYSGRSQSGHVTVKVTGAGAVADVRYDVRWLVEAHELNIGRETADAFRAAYRRAGERTVADMVADSPLGEVQALSQDPLGLARRLYLRED
jgi:DNA-binding protein YbaB